MFQWKGRRTKVRRPLPNNDLVWSHQVGRWCLMGIAHSDASKFNTSASVAPVVAAELSAATGSGSPAPMRHWDYKGVRYRSQLDARHRQNWWELGMDNDYEPALGFPYHIVDGLLKGPEPAVVEIKPVSTIREAQQEAYRWIWDASGGNTTWPSHIWPHSAILLGLSWSLDSCDILANLSLRDGWDLDKQKACGIYVWGNVSLDTRRSLFGVVSPQYCEHCGAIRYRLLVKRTRLVPCGHAVTQWATADLLDRGNEIAQEAWDRAYMKTRWEPPGMPKAA